MLNPGFSLKFTTSRVVRFVMDSGKSPVNRLLARSSERIERSGERSGMVPVRPVKLRLRFSREEQLSTSHGKPPCKSLDDRSRV